MAYSFKSRENLNKGSTEYNRYYGNFRGVDFSSDHTQVHASRLAYLVNMYKDYKSGQGEALETMAGFRRRANFGKIPVVSSGKYTGANTTYTNDEIYGIFYFKCKVSGSETETVLVHSGKRLFLWRTYPENINVQSETGIIVPSAASSQTVNETVINTYNISLPFGCDAIVSLKTAAGDELITATTYNPTTKVLSLISSTVQKDDSLYLTYYASVSKTSDILFQNMAEHKSVSFIFNNRLYLLDGQNYLVFDGSSVSQVKNNAYVPTTYIGIVPAGENADIGQEYEQRNILTPKFKHTFIADGTTREFAMNEDNLDSVVSVKVYGTATADYSVNLTKGTITLGTAPKKPEEVGYEQGYAGVEITASKVYASIDGVTDNMSDISELITKCTLCTTFDGRVFCTGNPDYQNYVFFCGRNSTGYADPSYFGILNYMQDGVGLSPITGIMCVSDTLMVLKADTQQDSSIYFHTATNSNQNLLPRIYPSVQGLSGLGCVGACCNFLDDPIFVSRLGVEGVSKLKVASERSNEHRSHLIDAKLVNTDLSKAVLEEWGGYLCVLTAGGQIYLADSRQCYQDSTGAMQYEWYYLEDIGVWENQYREFKYASALPFELINAETGKGIKFSHEDTEYEIEIADAVYFADTDETKNLCDTVANEPNADGNESKTIHTQIISVDIDNIPLSVSISYVIHEITDPDTNAVIERHAYLCQSRGNFTGGLFKRATTLYSMSDNLFFGCVNGVVCSFNFDERDSDGEMPPNSYSYDNRTINCGCATKMDCCDIPHLTKTTIKRSTVIKTKSFKNSAAKVKVRTNKKPYTQIARINSGLFSFNDVDFSDFSFITTDQSLFAIKEKEKQWVEKQYYVYSDEYLKPFSLYYISYRYRVAGRYKG